MNLDLIKRYQDRRAELLPKLQAFERGDQPFLVVQATQLDVYTNCRTVADIYDSNVRFFERQLSVKSDWLPYLEPWMGTGIYASAFGCKYHWREGDSPAVHYKYHSLSEIADIPEPRIEDSEEMMQVLDTIRHFREQTSDQIPIALTDTQSANDTATLVIDAAELLTGCYSNPDLVHKFTGAINRLIIEFSRRQIEAIGSAPVSRPGHIMVSDESWSGISISDDNLSVVSPEIGREFCLKYDQELADAFGGLAIHSCGRWQHLMPDAAAIRGLVQIDCAVHKDSDPNPNDPEAVRDAFAGTGVAVKVRGPFTQEPWYDVLPRLAANGVRLVVQIANDPDLDKSAANYDEIHRLLEKLYS